MLFLVSIEISVPWMTQSFLAYLHCVSCDECKSKKKSTGIECCFCDFRNQLILVHSFWNTSVFHKTVWPLSSFIFELTSNITSGMFCSTTCMSFCSNKPNPAQITSKMNGADGSADRACESCYGKFCVTVLCIVKPVLNEHVWRKQRHFMRDHTNGWKELFCGCVHAVPTLTVKF